jgi:formylglycine-generating enzyme required for sulfatase activity
LYGCNLNNDGFFNSAVDGEWIACNYLSWMDVAAYLDWAALRPMTELEYEKAARGFLSAVNGEYSWGTTSIVAANNITSSGTSGEYSATISANAVCSNQANVSGPMRVGGFSFVSNKRFLAGAGWWGICELSGNVWERTVMVGSATGRSYTGMHGNGSLTATGNANVTSWPGLSSGEVSGAAGAGFRGGGWNSAFTQCRTSSRIDAASPASTRIAASGGRGVRSAR